MKASPGSQLRALLFDKDGTLLDLQASWAGWTATLVDELAGGDRVLASHLDDVLGLDRVGSRLLPHSVVIAGSPIEISETLSRTLGEDAVKLERRIALLADSVVPVPVCRLDPLLDDLALLGLALGVATNDAEQPAQKQLRALGVADRFAAILGYDSGYGAKPGPGMCTGFAELVGLDPSQVAMVGDSLHDMQAGRNAGMFTIGVLTGGLERDELSAHASIVFDSIEEIPAWLRG